MYRRWSVPRRLLIAFMALSVAWAVFALLVVPHVIRDAYAGRSLAFLNAIIEGKGSHPVEYYLSEWRRLALLLTLGGAVVTALVLLAWRFRQPTGKGALRRATSTVLVGCSLALVSGLLEAWYRATGVPATRWLPTFGYEFFWVAPAGMLLLSAPLILAVGLMRWTRPDWVTLPRAVFILSVLPLLALSELVIRERMPDAVQLILALGLTAQLARFSARHEAAVERVSRLIFPALLAVPLVTFGAVVRARTYGERAVVRDLPAAPVGALNVLIIVWDAVRARELGLYGYGLKTTPHLEQRAVAGVVFERGYSTAPWTLPSHASLFTGRATQELTVDWTTPLERSVPTLAEVLASHGFRTGGFTANLLVTVRPSGLARGFHHYEDWPVTWHPRDYLSHLTLVRTLRRYAPFSRFQSFQLYRKDASQVTESFLQWLDGPVGGDRPFFAFLNYFNAHQPYWAPLAFRQRFPGDTAQSRYDAAIAFQDAELERLFEALSARGFLDRTVVILTADHGEAFGDHGHWGHAGTLHVEQLHVPLVLWAPGQAPAGLRVAASVSLADVPTTILDLALPDPPLDKLGGRSLSRFWRGLPPAADTIVSGYYWPVVGDTGSVATTKHGSSVIIERFHYILTHAELLFDLADDPEERRNLAEVDSLQRWLSVSREYLRNHFDPAWSRIVAPRQVPPIKDPP